MINMHFHVNRDNLKFVPAGQTAATVVGDEVGNRFGFALDFKALDLTLNIRYNWVVSKSINRH